MAAISAFVNGFVKLSLIPLSAKAAARRLSRKDGPGLWRHKGGAPRRVDA